MTGNRKITPTWRGWKVTFTQKGQKEYIHSRPAYGVEKKTTKSGQHSKRVLDRGGNTATTSKWRWNVRGGQWWLLMMILKMFIIMTIISIVLGTNYNTLSSEQKTKTKQLQELRPPKEVWLGSIVWRRIFFVFSASFFFFD